MVIKETDNIINYINYIGETTKLAKRQKEHLTFNESALKATDLSPLFNQNNQKHQMYF